MGIGGNVGDTVSLPHSQPLQGRRPAVAPLEELPIGQPQIIVDDGLSVWIETACAAGKLQRSQRDFHVCLPSGCNELRFTSIAPKLYRLREAAPQEWRIPTCNSQMLQRLAAAF